MDPQEHEIEPDSSRGQGETPDSGASQDAPDEHPADLGPSDRLRLRKMFDAHYDAVWRLMRRLGLDAATADDGAQQVFIVATRRLSDIESGKERAFLCASAARVASALRQRAHKKREQSMEADEGGEPAAPDSHAGADELVDRKRKRELLDALLGEMEEDLRVVLVLAEMEGFGKREIAESLGIAEGTAASRLRRAREDFKARLTRHLARRGR